jgi:riboflavin synthase
MKIKTDYYGFFLKSNGKWSHGPYMGELMTRQDVIDSGVLEDEQAPFEKHLKAYLKDVRRQSKKQVKFMRQVWEEWL